MKKTIVIAGILFAALVGGAALQATPADAGPFGGPPRLEEGGRKGEPGERFLARMSEVLDLSAEQQEKIKAILEEHRNKVAPLRQSLDESRDKLRQAAKADTFDEAAVRSLAANQAAAKTELMVERARMKSQIRALLTPEQRKLAEEKLDRWTQRRGGRHHGQGCR